MLSILIPIYNFNTFPLVKELHQQAEQCAVPYEIIAIDDCSTEKKPDNQEIKKLSHCTYIELNENIGRSAIRNLLAEKAQYNYLLFLDCDSAVSSKHYIKNYLPHCKPNIVCYGGRSYQTKAPADNTFLRWKYGVERESKLAELRNENPNFGFCSNNFLIDKKVLETVPFNSLLSGYGHEDTLFGIELEHHHIIIQHIDNTLVHLGLESAETFLHKTENCVRNLYKMEQFVAVHYPEIKHKTTKLSTAAYQIEKLHIKKLVSFTFKCMAPLLRRSILGKKPSLFLFDIYRLGYFCSIKTDKLTAGSI